MPVCRVRLQDVVKLDGKKETPKSCSLAGNLSGSLQSVKDPGIELTARAIILNMSSHTHTHTRARAHTHTHAHTPPLEEEEEIY